MPTGLLFGEGNGGKTICRQRVDSVTLMPNLTRYVRGTMRAAGVAFLLLTAACATGDDTPLAPRAAAPFPPPPSAPSNAPTATFLDVRTDTESAFVGMRRRIHLEARTQRELLGTDDVFVSIGGTATVELVQTLRFAMQEPSGRITQHQSPIIKLLTPGTVIVRATLNGIADSVVFVVQSSPPPTMAIAVDSFSVVEYRDPCVGGCGYLVYVPVLKLREPTGAQSVEVVSVEFTIPGASTGMCRGDRSFPPGASLHLNGQFDYLWSNDLIFVSLDGTPFPNGDATAEIIVRDAQGGYGRVFVSGPIHRNVVAPLLPLPVWPDLGWEC